MKNKFLFILLFIVLGFVALQIPINYLAGAKVKFTLFDLFAPISGAFIGTFLGAISVVVMQIANLAYHGFAGFNGSSFLTIIATLRILPLIAGVIYFANVQQLSFWGAKRHQNQKHDEHDSGQARMTKYLGAAVLVLPLLAIIAFNLHPVGRSVWYYSLFWTIPYLVLPFANRFLLLRSLGSAFTAHAVGGAIWIWAFNLPASVWVSLIPVVIMERVIFALGMSASYILMNNILGFLASKKLLPRGITFSKKYLFR